MVQLSFCRRSCRLRSLCIAEKFSSSFIPPKCHRAQFRALILNACHVKCSLHYAEKYSLLQSHPVCQGTGMAHSLLVFSMLNSSVHLLPPNLHFPLPLRKSCLLCFALVPLLSFYICIFTLIGWRCHLLPLCIKPGTGNSTAKQYVFLPRRPA